MGDTYSIATVLEGQCTIPHNNEILNDQVCLHYQRRYLAVYTVFESHLHN